MNLELIIQSEVSQEQKDKYHISKYIYIWNLEPSVLMALMNRVCRAATQTQTEDRHRAGRRGRDELRQQRWSMRTASCEIREPGDLLLTRDLESGLCDHPESWDGVGVGRRFTREGTYLYSWLIHADVWQKPTRYYKAIIWLKIKKFKFLKRHLS